MIRVFKHYVPNAVVLLGLLDFLLLLVAAEAGWQVRAWQIGMDPEQVHTRILPLLAFADPAPGRHGRGRRLLGRMRCSRCASQRRGCWWGCRSA
ncbi:hypothetical protein AB5I41_28195 [Sphingomonas sp. MMS24-JH45]